MAVTERNLTVEKSLASDAEIVTEITEISIVGDIIENDVRAAAIVQE